MRNSLSSMKEILKDKTNMNGKIRGPAVKIFGNIVEIQNFIYCERICWYCWTLSEVEWFYHFTIKELVASDKCLDVERIKVWQTKWLLKFKKTLKLEETYYLPCYLLSQSSLSFCERKINTRKHYLVFKLAENI